MTALKHASCKPLWVKFSSFTESNASLHQLGCVYTGRDLSTVASSVLDILTQRCIRPMALWSWEERQ